MNHLQRRARERSASCQVEDQVLQVSLEELQLEKLASIFKKTTKAEAKGIRRMISINEKCDERTGDEVFEK